MNRDMSEINSINKRARIVGILFIIGTTAGILGAIIISPILNATDYLAKFSADQNQVLAGVFLELVMAVACASIAIWLYPVLKKYSESLALGAVGFRLIEAVFGFVSVLSLLLLLALSQEFVKAGAPDSSYYQLLGELLKAGHDWVGPVIMLLPWCIGALMYYYIFYQTKLVPRWLSGWGIIAVTLSIAATILVLFSVIEPFSTAQIIFNFLIMVQEMVLAVWLIVKGFNPSAILSEPLKQPVIR
jgi:MFS family permease